MFQGHVLETEDIWGRWVVSKAITLRPQWSVDFNRPPSPPLNSSGVGVGSLVDTVPGQSPQGFDLGIKGRRKQREIIIPQPNQIPGVTSS